MNGEWRELENQCQESEVSVADSTSYEMGGLQGDSLYRIELRAHNAIGYSEPANLLLKTVRGESKDALGTLLYSYSEQGASIASTYSHTTAACHRSFAVVVMSSLFVFVAYFLM